MKIKVLIKENIDKTYNVLEMIKNNKNLAESQDLFTFYNDENWLGVFKKAYDDFKKGKFKRFIIIDDFGYGPFLFLSKQKGIIATTSFDEYSAYLSRGHNNSKVCIIPIKRLHNFESLSNRINNIIHAFCVAEFEAGRHVTRLRILHGSLVDTDKPITFSATPTKTVVVGSDHAGFALKEAIKEHLIEKGYKVIDVGTNSLDSTHYSMFGLAMTRHFHEASYAIGCCWTGMGMANTLNKFKGIRACISMYPENAKFAREIYGANVLVIGSKFSSKERTFETVDAYLETKPKQNPIYKALDDYGFALDLNKFKEVTANIETGIVIPEELK